MFSASDELAPKLNFTVVPGWAASNCLPRVVNDSVNEAAANTVTVPEAPDRGVAGLEPEPDEVSPPEPQAAARAVVRHGAETSTASTEFFGGKYRLCGR
jgi:hypothetical protein